MIIILTEITRIDLCVTINLVIFLCVLWAKGATATSCLICGETTASLLFLIWGVLTILGTVLYIVYTILRIAAT